MSITWRGLRAAIRAAEHLNKGVIIQTGTQAYAYGREAQFGPSIVVAASRSAASIGVQMDHARNIDHVRTAIRDGYTSVMLDGSHLPFDKNVALVRGVAQAVHRAGRYLEAELGRTAGEEDWSSGEAPDRAMTDPAAAEEFARSTKVDTLAVNIGNAHGLYLAPAARSRPFGRYCQASCNPSGPTWSIWDPFRRSQAGCATRYRQSKLQHGTATSTLCRYR